MRKNKSITIDDVAKAAGVSKSTVSQFLNGRYEYMSEKTRKKIEHVVKELNFQPNHLASNLKKKKSKTVGIIVANILHTLSTSVIQVIEQHLQQKGIHVIICNADDDPEKEINYLNILSSLNVDGLVVFPTGLKYDEYKRVIDQNIPIIFMDRQIEGMLTDTILLDNEAAAFLAVSTLVKRGRDRIAMFTQSIERGISPRIERIEGYKKALSFYNCEFQEEWLCSNTLSNLKNDLEKIFQMEEKPNGIIAGNDRVLAVVLHFLKEKNISIPEDVAIIGIDDVSYAEIYRPSLTTIAQPVKEMAEKAAEILLSRMEEKEAGVPIVYRFSPELKLRSSC